MDAFKINEGADTATIADGDIMSFSGRIQNAGGSTMMAADTDSQFRFALQAAGSVAGLMITTEAMVSELPAEEGAAPAGMPGGMPDMGGMM